MDVSALFKASVKMVCLRYNDLEITSNNLKKMKSKSAFFTKAQGVVTQISQLHQFLLENRKAYLNFSKYLPNVPSMTDADRDEIDIGAEKIMSSCSQLIRELRREIAGSDVSPQYLEHREIMLLLIQDYLKNVCKIYSEHKAIRVKRAMEIRKIAKLEIDIKPAKQLEVELKKLYTNEKEKQKEQENKGESNDSSPLKVQELNGDVTALMYEEEISPEDIQLFEAENEQLYNELDTLTEEVKQIESKVVHIAELQQVLTEKVLDQDKDLDRLLTTVVGSTENVKEANKQIRQAIQRNAGLRVWILFFLLVMSFSLLFLDWYNP